MGQSPGNDCRTAAGEFAPTIDRAKCEGKAESAKVCPFDVFEVRRMDDADFARLGMLAKRGSPLALTQRGAEEPS